MDCYFLLLANRKCSLKKIGRFGAAKYSTVQCSAVQCSAVQCSAVQCSEVQCSAVQCSAVQCSAVQNSTVQCSAVQCSTVQYSTVQYSTVQYLLILLTTHKCMPCPSLAQAAISKNILENELEFPDAWSDDMSSEDCAAAKVTTS